MSQKSIDPSHGPGKCGSASAASASADRHIMHEWTPEQMLELSEFTLGHENAGWIDALGDGVSGWEPG